MIMFGAYVVAAIIIILLIVMSDPEKEVISDEAETEVELPKTEPMRKHEMVWYEDTSFKKSSANEAPRFVQAVRAKRCFQEVWDGDEFMFHPMEENIPPFKTTRAVVKHMTPGDFLLKVPAADRPRVVVMPKEVFTQIFQVVPLERLGEVDEYFGGKRP